MTPSNLVNFPTEKGEILSGQSYSVLSPTGKKAKLTLSGGTNEPKIVGVEGEAYLEGSVIQSVEMRILSRAMEGYYNVVDTGVVVVRTAKGPCRVRFVHEQPKSDVKPPEAVWTIH